MSVHARQVPPAGHGEVLCEPRFEEWDATARANAAAAAGWPSALAALRAEARAEALDRAAAYSESIGSSAAKREAGGLIVATGHQPTLFHPGVWVKHLLIQRFAETYGATGIDVVVDTDAAGRVELTVPCLEPEVRTCGIPLVDAPAQAAYVQVPAPGPDERSAFRAAGMAALSRLPAPALGRHFDAFCDALDASAPGVSDAGSLVTAARRRYERAAGTDYLELPVSVQARGAAFRRFAAGYLADAEAVRSAMNAALGAYRARTGTRSLAQPFPDLARDGGVTEAPFWVLVDGRRAAAGVDDHGSLCADGVPMLHLGGSAEEASAALARHDVLLAPKAIVLTLFERLFVADLFVHGTGGGRYDRVTDEFIRAYHGIEPPAYAVASMTLLLPLGGRLTTDAEVSALEERLNRCTHNPDRMLGEIEFDSIEEREAAEALATRKKELVEAIAVAGADRKELGREIRETNQALASAIEPVRREIAAELETVRAARAACAVLTDRTYPFCLWDPREVMDKVR